MTEQSTAQADRSGPTDLRGQEPRGNNPVSRMFGTIALFLQQVFEELSKVVRPTRQELISYTMVVVVFVTAMMAFVFGLDQFFEWLVKLVFGD